MQSLLLSVVAAANATDSNELQGGQTYIIGDYECANHQYCLINDDDVLQPRSVTGMGYDIKKCLSVCSEVEGCVAVDIQSYTENWEKSQDLCYLLKADTFKQVPNCTHHEQWMSCKRRNAESDNVNAGAEVEKLASSSASKSEQDASDMAVTTAGGAEVGSKWPGDHVWQLHTQTMMWDCANYQYCKHDGDAGVIDRMDRWTAHGLDMIKCVKHCENLGDKCLGIDMQSGDKNWNKYNGSKGDNYNRAAWVDNCTFWTTGAGSWIPDCTKNASYVSCRRRHANGQEADPVAELASSSAAEKEQDASDMAVTTSADVEPVAVDAEKKPLKKNLLSSKPSIQVSTEQLQGGQTYIIGDYECANQQYCLINDDDVLQPRDVTGMGYDIKKCLSVCSQVEGCVAVDIQSYTENWEKSQNLCYLLKANTFKQIPNCTQHAQWMSCKRRNATEQTLLI